MMSRIGCRTSLWALGQAGKVAGRKTGFRKRRIVFRTIRIGYRTSIWAAGRASKLQEKQDGLEDK